MYSSYYEYGLHTIPILKRSKMPVADAKGFNEWAMTGVPEEKIAHFEKRYPIEAGYGIALLCGPASGVCVVDIDTDNKSILNDCPLSPVVRRGAKGEARFFQIGEGVSNHNFNNGTWGIDLLIEKKYILLPPSIHPDGMAYKWTGVHELMGNVDSLPMHEIDDETHIANLVGVKIDGESFGPVELDGIYNSPDGKRCPHGSHDRIKRMIAGMIKGQTDINEAIDKLLSYDEAHHKGVTFFGDKRFGSDFGADPRSNALKMYVNVLHSVNTKHKRKGEPVELHERAPRVEVSDVEVRDIVVDKKPLLDLPVPKSGLLRVIHDDIMKHSHVPQTKFALGGALSLLAPFVAGRFSFVGQYPNMYNMIVGETGLGKDAPRGYAMQVLTHPAMKRFNLFGLANYSSAPMFLSGLPTQRCRLDIIDEFSGFLRGMFARDLHKRGVALEMAHLWSLNGRWYGGNKAMNRRTETYECWGPSVSLLALVQPETLVASTNKDMLDSGFLPRFMVFYEDQKQALVDDVIDLDQNVDSMIDELYRAFDCTEKLLDDSHIEGNDVSTNMGMCKLKPKKIIIGKSEKKYLNEVAHYFFAKQHVEGADFVDKAFNSRAFEHLCRVVCVLIVSHGRDAVSKNDIDYGRVLVENIISNSKTLMLTASAKDSFEKDYERLRGYIEKRKIVTKTELANCFRNAKLKESIVGNMLDAGDITQVQIGKGVGFKWIK